MRSGVREKTDQQENLVADDKVRDETPEFQEAGQAPRNQNRSRAVSAFKDLKTGTKVTGAFLIIALIIVGVAVVGYRSIKSVNAGMTTLYEDRLLPAQQLGNVNEAQLKIQTDLYRCILVPEDRDKLKQDIAEHIKFADQNIKQYELTFLVPDEERGLAEFRPAWADYLRAVEENMRLVKTGDTRTALQSVGEGGAVFAAQQAVNQILTRLIEVQVQVGIDLKQDGDQTFGRASAIMMAAGVIGVLSAIALGMLMGRSITIPLARITGVATDMAKGKLDTSLLAGIASKNEIGMLASTFTLMADQLKRTEEELRNLNQELEQRVADRTALLEAANKELEAFAYSVSHDLRAPLRHIDGFLELLQKRTATALDEQSRHYMGIISKSARHMGILIDDLLSFSRMGRNQMSNLRVDLGELTREVIREFEPETGNRNIHWRVCNLPVVNGDHAMLRMVLVNLISNALKFTQPRRQAEIEIGWMRPQETETVIFVRDNGVGFDMNYVDRLFGIFQRLHRPDEFEGTGIGLANVRRIINRHGGRTWAEGQVNQGATFYFSLPRSIQET